MKRSIINNAAIIAILGFLALERVYLVSPEGLQIAGIALSMEVAILMTVYFIAIQLNVRLLVPRLLLRNHFVAYILVLLAIAMSFTGIEVAFERLLLIGHYCLSPEQYWYFSDNSFLFFELLSSVTVYFISIAGTAIIFFLRLWNQSGKRMRDLKEQNARNELEKVRTQIDSETLFATLDRAADIVCQSPSDASAMLMKLSKSLRKQLYDSEHRQHSVPAEISAQTFNLSSPALNFLTDKRFRIRRHLLLITGFLMIQTTNFNGTLSSLLYMLLPSLLIIMSLIYFNILVLFPKLMMQNKIRAYLAAVTLTVLVIAIPAQAIHTLNIGGDGHNTVWMLTIYAISNIIKISFSMISVDVILLFQYWVRNERHITELETSTLISELEQLQNQVNPHFLFNMLNNIIVLTRKNPAEAADILHKLSDMLKYQFHGFTKQIIRLGDDVRFLTDFLNLEKLRRDNFEFSIAAGTDIKEITLPPLLFIPFVENAVKHNNDNRNLSFVHLRFTLVNDTLGFECINSKPHRLMRKDEVGGLGLPNVRRRLDLLYGNRYHLDITENDTSYSVQLNIEFKNKKI